jgi:hypothetical protein
VNSLTIEEIISKKLLSDVRYMGTWDLNDSRLVACGNIDRNVLYDMPGSFVYAIYPAEMLPNLTQDPMDLFNQPGLKDGKIGSTGTGKGTVDIKQSGSSRSHNGKSSRFKPATKDRVDTYKRAAKKPIKEYLWMWDEAGNSILRRGERWCMSFYHIENTDKVNKTSAAKTLEQLFIFVAQVIQRTIPAGNLAEQNHYRHQDGSFSSQNRDLHIGANEGSTLLNFIKQD